MRKNKFISGLALVFSLIVSTGAYADYQTNLVFSGYLQNSFGDIDVGLYSVPVVYDWNNDGQKDLLVGQNNGSNGYVTYFENIGTNAAPSFDSGNYIQSCTATCSPLNVAAGG